MWRSAPLLAATALLLSVQAGVAQPPPIAALAIEKTVTPSGVLVPGNLVTYTSVATNEGPAAALNMTITDPLPAQTVFIAGVASPGATLTTPAVGANGPVTSVWDAAGGTPGGLTPVDTDRTLTVVARVCPETACGPLDNTATASADPVSTSAMSTASTTTSPQVDLAITKSGPMRLRRGETFTYTLNISNAGPSNAPAVQVVDTLPAGFIATDVNPSVGAICSVALDGSTVTCTPDDPIGAANQCTTTFATSFSITITVEVPENLPAGQYTNVATVALTGDCGTDTNPANNTATAVTLVLADPGVPVLSPLAAGALVLLLWGLGTALVRRRRA